MNIKMKLLGLLTLFIIGGCSTYTYWDISQFEMKPEALADGEEIKLIYASRGPDNNKDLEYYYHFVVVSQKTGDTVNLLTVINSYVKKTDGDTIYNYFDGDNMVTHMAIHNPKSLIDENGKMRKFEPILLDKVARDPEFDKIADNDFPTVIGSIGKFGGPEEYEQN